MGVGIAWASILSMPYAILTGSLPPSKMGYYMGVFNFFIVIPQIVAAAILGFVVGTVLIVLANRRFKWLILGVPGVFYFLYMSWFVWRFKGSFENAFFLTGRETTWKKALEIALRNFGGTGASGVTALLEPASGAHHVVLEEAPEVIVLVADRITA